MQDPADLLLKSAASLPHAPGGNWPPRALHLDALYPHDLQPLSEPVRLFTFDWLHPPGPEGQQLQLQVSGSVSGASKSVLAALLICMPHLMSIIAVHQNHASISTTVAAHRPDICIKQEVNFSK